MVSPLDLAKPVLEADSHAKVPMRKKVRVLRTIEHAVLKQQQAEAEIKEDLTPRTPGATGTATAAATPSAAAADPADSIASSY